MIRLTPEQRVFLTERHLGALTTIRPDGTPHVVPVAFTWDDAEGSAWITTHDGTVKVRNITHDDVAPARGALCQFVGGRWLTLEGTLAVSRDPEEIAEAERRHALRYPPLEPDPDRVLIRLHADAVLGSDYMTR